MQLRKALCLTSVAAKAKDHGEAPYPFAWLLMYCRSGHSFVSALVLAAAIFKEEGLGLVCVCNTNYDKSKS